MIDKYPFFSIITASFNSEKTIEDTIKSLLIQRFSNFEYIIVDGGSKDGTVGILKKYEPYFLDKNIQFKWISEKDNGIYDAWNKGVVLSSGKWISFLGSDDLYLEDSLSIYFEAINTNTEANFFCSVIDIVNANKDFLYKHGGPFDKNILRRKMDFAQVGAFHKKEIFKETGPFNDSFKIVGDYDFYLRASNIIAPFFIDKTTALMRNEGVSNQAFKALKEARDLKNKNNINTPLINNFDFILNLTKVYIKKLLRI